MPEFSPLLLSSFTKEQTIKFFYTMDNLNIAYLGDCFQESEQPITLEDLFREVREYFPEITMTQLHDILDRNYRDKGTVMYHIAGDGRTKITSPGKETAYHLTFHPEYAEEKDYSELMEKAERFLQQSEEWGGKIATLEQVVGEQEKEIQELKQKVASLEGEKGA